jgi:hypothetical protein
VDFYLVLIDTCLKVCWIFEVLIVLKRLKTSGHHNTDKSYKFEKKKIVRGFRLPGAFVLPFESESFQSSPTNLSLLNLTFPTSYLLSSLLHNQRDSSLLTLINNLRQCRQW